MSNLIEVQPEYLYTSIPREYVGVYHRILAMMADYGEDMLKDCKASCTERNSGVIECFNMFNSAVAARKLGNTKLAETLINYVKAKIEMIYNGKDNSTSFIYPLDEYGELNAIVSGGDPVKFEIDADKGELYKIKYADGFKSWYDLSKIQGTTSNNNSSIPVDELLYAIPEIINDSDNNYIRFYFAFTTSDEFYRSFEPVPAIPFVDSQEDFIFNFYIVSNVHINGTPIYNTPYQGRCGITVGAYNKWSEYGYTYWNDIYNYINLEFNIEKYSVDKKKFMELSTLIHNYIGGNITSITNEYYNMYMLFGASFKDWTERNWDLGNYQELFDFRDTCRTAVYEGFSFQYDNREYETY